jgi:hypothetical protein
MLFLTEVLALASAASASPSSNEQVIINAVRAGVDSLLGKTGDMGAEVRVVADSGGLRRLIAEGIADGLRDKYNRILIGGGSDSLSDILTYDILGFAFDYEKGSSRGFLRGRKIKREMLCELRINIQGGPTGILRHSQNMSVAYADEIEHSDLRFVNSREIPELAPEPPGSGWSRFGEPALVTASVGALVYLFFANR